MPYHYTFYDTNNRPIVQCDLECVLNVEVLHVQETNVLEIHVSESDSAGLI